MLVETVTSLPAMVVSASWQFTVASLSVDVLGLEAGGVSI